jgi:hypothetical protein
MCSSDFEAWSLAQIDRSRRRTAEAILKGATYLTQLGSER